MPQFSVFKPGGPSCFLKASNPLISVSFYPAGSELQMQGAGSTPRRRQLCLVFSEHLLCSFQYAYVNIFLYVWTSIELFVGIATKDTGQPLFRVLIYPQLYQDFVITFYNSDFMSTKHLCSHICWLNTL